MSVYSAAPSLPAFNTVIPAMHRTLPRASISLMRRLPRTRLRGYLCMSVLCAACVFASAQTQGRPAQPRPTVSRHVVVVGAGEWTESHVALEQGDTLVIDSKVRHRSGSDGTTACGPEGKTRTWEDLLLAYPVNTAGKDALIGRIGPDPAVPFVIGEHLQVTASQSGQLFLGLNMLDGEQSSCAFNVAVRIVPAMIPEAYGREPLKVPSALLGRIPRRVVDGSGRSGDLVNFVLVGSEEQVLSAFQRAGWLPVDRTPEEAVIHVLLASIDKQAYTEMPMSDLYLFGRVQDYGFSRAKPVEVITARHHLRIWRTTFQLGTKPVWAGAATHDIGLEPDQRPGGSVTHAIDPNVDKERDFLQSTLMAGGGVRGSDLQLPRIPMKKGRTATGESFRSDGRILEIILRD
jgi:hypothetical protein